MAPDTPLSVDHRQRALPKTQFPPWKNSKHQSFTCRFLSWTSLATFDDTIEMDTGRCNFTQITCYSELPGSDLLQSSILRKSLRH